MDVRFFRVLCLVAFLIQVAGQVSAQQAIPDARSSLFKMLFDWHDAREKAPATPAEKKSFLAALNIAIDWGADLNGADKDGQTPLTLASYWAAWRTDGVEFNDIVTLLLERGADPNVVTVVGTPMHLAATGMQNGKLIQILCAAGARTDIQIPYEGPKMTALDMARKFDRLGHVKNAMEKCVTKR
jgi:Ankyrin repeat